MAGADAAVRRRIRTCSTETRAARAPGTGASISANLAAVGIGTETDGSIVCPSSACGLVGIKPTLGLVSRSGIIPISHSQDTAGPMARTVADAAALLAVLSGVDSRDTATADCRAVGCHLDYTHALNAAALKGARIGVARNFFGFSDAVDRVMDEAIAAMKSAGATIIDPANIATAGKFDDAEIEVLLYEFKADLNAYLGALGASAPHKTLAALIAFNEQNKDREMPYFGQETFIAAQAKGPLTSSGVHGRAREVPADVAHGGHRCDAREAPPDGDRRPDRRTGVADRSAQRRPLHGRQLDAVGGRGLSERHGAGRLRPRPARRALVHRCARWSDATLVGLAYAFEQATKVRTPPRSRRPLGC